MTATTVSMNPSRCGGVSPAATTTLKSDLKRSSTVRAAPAVPRSQRRRQAGAPPDATKLMPTGTKTTSVPAAWLASGPGKPGKSVGPTSAPDAASGTINAAAAAPWDGLSALQENPPHPQLKTLLSPPAAIQRQTVQRQTAQHPAEDAPAPIRAPQATPDVRPKRPWRRIAPTATASLPAAHGRPPADHGTTAPASTTEAVASSAADPPHQCGAGGLQRSQ